MEGPEKIRDVRLETKLTKEGLNEALKILDATEHTGLAHLMWQGYERSVVGLSDCLNAIGVTEHDQAWKAARYIVTAWLNDRVPSAEGFVEFNRGY